MNISARAFSLADRPQVGHSGHQCSHAPGRPILHLVSSSRRPRLETGDRVTSSLAPHIAQFLCSSQGPFVPVRRTSIASRAGAVKAWRSIASEPLLCPFGLLWLSHLDLLAVLLFQPRLFMQNTTFRF